MVYFFFLTTSFFLFSSVNTGGSGGKGLSEVASSSVSNGEVYAEKVDAEVSETEGTLATTFCGCGDLCGRGGSVPELLGGGCGAGGGRETAERREGEEE
jgi:hypothetical protein